MDERSVKGEADAGTRAAAAGDRVGELLKLAGRRPLPDPRRVAQARDAAAAEWSQLLEQRRAHALGWRFGGAAVAAALLVGWLAAGRSTPPPRVAIATVSAVSGPIVVTTIGERPRTVTAAGAWVRSGDRVETPDGSRMSFVLPGGTSVKVDGTSRIRLRAADSIALEQGTMYVDTGVRDHWLRIETPLGVVRHVGTRFEVRVQAAALRVRVREGTVTVATEERQWSSNAGEAFFLARHRRPERYPVATHGAEWQWMAAIAEPFELEGATLRAFLEWVSRHQGWRWEYETAAMHDRFDDVVLHGAIDGLTAHESLDAVLPTCGLAYRQAGGRLIVSSRAVRGNASSTR